MRHAGVIAAILRGGLYTIAVAVATSSATEGPKLRLQVDRVIGPDAGSVHFGRIVDIAVNSLDQIYVLDASAPAIHTFTNDGRYLSSIRGGGDAVGQFNAPSCLAIGSDDRLYVAGADSQIEVLDANGQPVTRIKRASTSPVQSIAVDDHGDLYVVSLNLFDQKMIEKYAGRSSQLVQSFCDSYAVGQDVDTREEEFYAQGSIAVQNDRVLYVQSYPHKIRIFDLSGSLIKEFDARVAESQPPQTRIDLHGVQLKVSESFSRTIVPLEEDLLLTILALPFEGSSGTGYLDIYRASDGTRVSSLADPPTPVISCRDRRGRLYSIEARNGAPVVVRYRLEAAEPTTGSGTALGAVRRP